MEYRILPCSFYERSSKEVAPDLLGIYLIRTTQQGRCVGRIIEVEAYLGPEDPASHAAAGLTARTKTLFGPAGHAYVYFTYGMHYCLNAVCGSAGSGQGVLLRAVEPVEGIELMQERRRKTDTVHLCDGPAKLTQAFAIGPKQNGQSLQSRTLYLAKNPADPPLAPEEIHISARIGISRAVDWPLRFVL